MGVSPKRCRHSVSTSNQSHGSRRYFCGNPVSGHSEEEEDTGESVSRHSHECRGGSMSSTDLSILAEATETPRFSVYRRVLPSPPAIEFSTAEGRELFTRALAQGNMAGYFALAEQFAIQDEPAYCGLSTLTMTLNTLAIDPKRIWKGIWRWYSDSMLNCCRPLELVQRVGVDFDEFVCLARCNGCKVVSKRPSKTLFYEKAADTGDFALVSSTTVPTTAEALAAGSVASGTKEESGIVECAECGSVHPSDACGAAEHCIADLAAFREDVSVACRSEREPILVMSYSRAALEQTGDGHYTTIGGFDAETDMVLILDVARYKYPSHWLPLAAAFEAMTWSDASTGRNRGWMLVSRDDDCKSVFFKLFDSVQRQTEASAEMKGRIEKRNPEPSEVDFDIATIYYRKLPSTLCSADCQGSHSAPDVVQCVLTQLPDGLRTVFTTYGARIGDTLSRDQMLEGIRDTGIYAVVGEVLRTHPSVLAMSGPLRAEMATLLFLIIPPSIWNSLGRELAADMRRRTRVPLRHVSLHREICALQNQLRFLRDLKLSHDCEHSKRNTADGGVTDH